MGAVFLVCSTYKTYTFIGNRTNKKQYTRFIVLISFIICLLFLHVCRKFFVNTYMLIGEEM